MKCERIRDVVKDDAISPPYGSLSYKNLVGGTEF